MSVKVYEWMLQIFAIVTWRPLDNLFIHKYLTSYLSPLFFLFIFPFRLLIVLKLFTGITLDLLPIQVYPQIVIALICRRADQQCDYI
jgi:hypothetical protein